MKLNLTDKIMLDVANLERFRGGWGLYGGLSRLRMESLEKKVAAEAAELFPDLPRYSSFIETIPDQQRALYPTEGGLVSIVEGLTGQTAPGFKEGGKEACSALLEQVKEGLEKGERHPLLVTALFVVQLLQLSPLIENNEALAMSFLRVLLFKSGFHFIRVIPVELALRDRVLAKAPVEDATDWIAGLLALLVKQKIQLEHHFLLEDKLLSFSDTEERILSLAIDKPRVSISDIEAATEVNRNTLKPRLRALVKEGHLEQHGRGKATWYTSQLGV